MTSCPHGDDPNSCPPCQGPAVLGVVREDLKERTWTGTQAARIAGLTYRQLDYVDREGAIPATVPAAGSGTQRGYTFDDLVKLRILHHFQVLGGKLSLLFVKAAVEGGLAHGPVAIVIDEASARVEVAERVGLSRDLSVPIGGQYDLRAPEAVD